MKKHTDGNYYEKIVTWDREPKSIELIMGYVTAFVCVLGLISLLSLDLMIVRFETFFSILFALAVSLATSTILITENHGLGKKVKYRRIGK